MTAEHTTRSPYDAVRHAAAVLLRRDTACLDVSGADRIAWLQGLLTNDVAGLAPGQGCYAAYLTPQGRMIADLRVLVRDQSVWLDVPVAARDTVLQRFEMFIISEDLAVDDQSARVARLSAYGPLAARTLAAIFMADAAHRNACAASLQALAPHAHLSQLWESRSVLVAGNDEFGVSGFDVYVPADAAPDVLARATAAGAVNLDEDTWHTCRVEAGRPAWGLDLDEQVIPLEAGIEDRAISFTKGCYVGQEVIVRVRDRGQGRVSRRLMSFATVEPPHAPGLAFARGDGLIAGSKEVGRVTSAAWSPSLGRSIGLGYLQRAAAIDGDVIEVVHGDHRIAVRLHAGPLLPALAR